MPLPTFMTLDEMRRRSTSAAQALAIQTMAESVLLRNLAFKNLARGTAFEQFSTRSAAPSVQKRGLNEDFTPTRGATAPGSEPLRIYGLRLKYDRAAEEMGLFDPAEEIEAASRAIALTEERDLIYGDPDTDEREFAGFQYWAENSGHTSDTSISAGSTANGAALSLGLLREAIDNTWNPRMIVSGTGPRNLVTSAAADTTISGHITWDKDELGTRIMRFDGLPWLVVDRDVDDAKLLDFNEAAASGTATATSIYIVGGDGASGGWYPFQMGPVRTPEVNGDGVWKQEDMEHYVGTNRVHPRSVVRVKHIGNLAVTK